MISHNSREFQVIVAIFIMEFKYLLNEVDRYKAPKTSSSHNRYCGEY